MPGVISDRSVLVRTSWMLVQHDRNSLKSWHFKVTCSSISGTSRRHSSHILFSSIFTQLPVSVSNIYECVGIELIAYPSGGPGCLDVRLGIGEPLLDFLILAHQCDGGLCFRHLWLNFQKFKSHWIDTMSWFNSTIIYWRFRWYRLFIYVRRHLPTLGQCDGNDNERIYVF